jgi:hypothetical protein
MAASVRDADARGAGAVALWVDEATVAVPGST